MKELSSYSFFDEALWAPRMACPGQFPATPNSSSHSEAPLTHPLGRTNRHPCMSVSRHSSGISPVVLGRSLVASRVSIVSLFYPVRSKL